MHEGSSQTKLRVRVERGIYKRKTRGGRIRYEIAFLDSDARQRWRTVDSLREARQQRADLMSRIGRGERVAPSKLTFADYADTWLDGQEGRLRPTTHALYETYVRVHVKPRLGRRRLQAITVNDVAALIGEMQKGVRYIERDGRVIRETGGAYAAWTIRGVVTVLGRVMGSAARDGLISTESRAAARKGRATAGPPAGVPRT